MPVPPEPEDAFPVPAAAGTGRRSWPAASGLQRTRLLQVLDVPARALLVVAPAGYGKTTLLAQHAAGRGRVAWHRVTHEDADPRHLADSLRGALRRVGAIPGERSGVDGLFRELEDVPAEIRLVLDDAHLVVDSPAEATLERLLVDAPAGVSLLLGSRRAPGLNLCRAEVGQPVLIGADQLRFRSWEVEELFRDVYREPLPPDDVAALARRTGGWAACLQLFHLSTQSCSPAERSRAVGALAGGARFARAYLARTVLDELPEPLRAFLTRTAVFEVLTAERCDRLLGGSSSRGHLDELERVGALVTSDDGGRSFHCHEVLRRHLESVLCEELGVNRAQGWYLRAADILVTDGAPGEAVRACLRADRWDRATDLLHRAGSRALDVGPHWSDVLPAELVDEDPWLSTALARRLAMSGQLPAAAARYRRAESLFPDAVDRERTSRERRLVELWTGGRPQPHLHWVDRIRAAVDRTPEAGDAEASPGLGGRLVAAVTALLRGDIAAADDALAGMLRGNGGQLADPLGAPLAHLSARLVHALTALAGGASIAPEAEQIATEAERLGAAWFVRQARVLRALEARDGSELARLTALCTAAEDPWGALLADGAAAVAGLLTGHPGQDAFARVARRCADLGAGSLRAWALAFAALDAATGGAPTAVAARAAESAGHSCGVPGVQALAALAAAPHAVDPDLAAARARALARAHGLPWPEGLARRLLDATSGAGGAVTGRQGLTPEPRAAGVREPDAEPVHVRCLGGFELEMGGRGVDWSGVRPRAASALRLLALHVPRSVHRETLLQLWPGLPDGQARHSLQVAVSSLRSLLAPGAPRGESRMITRKGETYALDLPTGSRVDVAEFEALLAAAERARSARERSAELEALDRAVTLYRGELLPEDGAAEWVVRERDRFRLHAALACARLADLHAHEGDLSAAVAAARRGTEIDAFADPAWRSLISAYDHQGNCAAAARARQEYADVLDDLGVSAG
jgi:DNA-binding SARP family transcriptional activator